MQASETAKHISDLTSTFMNSLHKIVQRENEEHPPVEPSLPHDQGFLPHDQGFSYEGGALAKQAIDLIIQCMNESGMNHRNELTLTESSDKIREIQSYTEMARNKYETADRLNKALIKRRDSLQLLFTDAQNDLADMAAKNVAYKTAVQDLRKELRELKPKKKKGGK